MFCMCQFFFPIFKKILPLFFGILLFPNLNFAQSELAHKVYLIGNISELQPSSNYFQQLVKQLNKESQPTSLLVLGDMSRKKNRNKEPVFNSGILTEFNQIKNKNVKIHFMSGDLDWDNSGKDGWEHVKQLENYIKKNVTANHSFSPNDGCPGPHEIEVDESLVIITINSQWFMHPNERPELTSSSCGILFESEFWEELEDLIDDHEDKNVIIAAHHPIYSNGHYSGKINNWKNYIPFYGGIYESYRQQDGTPRDMSNKRYQNYNQHLRKIADENHGVVYVAGHEFNTEILKKKDNFFINNGASFKGRKLKGGKNTLFESEELSYSVIHYFEDGAVEVKVFDENEKILLDRNLLCPNCSEHTSTICEAVNHRYMPCQEMKTYSVDENFVKNLEGKTTTLVTGEQYRAGKFKTKMMGQHYRKEWTTPVELPYLDIGSVEGGMIPYAKGGGKQTDALKFVLSDGRQYGFRSVNKNTARDESFILNKTVVTDFSQDLISNQLPYGDVVTSILLDQTDILHMRPRAYVMPDDPRLGPFRKEFAGVIGTLEERPKGKKKGRPGFQGADKITSSNVMYRYLFKNNKHTIDPQSAARAMMFDLWVGDWDRHGDNWKWAGYKEDDHYLFKPIPKDRDHVFSIFEGLIAGTSEKLLPHAAAFTEEINSIYSFMFQGRHFTNFLNSKMTTADWQAAADYLQATFNAEIIEEAFDMMPKEIRSFSKERIKKILLARLGELDKAVPLIEKRFSKTGLIVGSNKREEFDIERLANGNVQVKMYDATSKKQARILLFEKTFDKNITEEIHLYGLGGKDKIYLRGDVAESIRIRVIAGHGEDFVEDLSKVANGKKATLVYDSHNEDEIKSSQETSIKQPFYEPNFNVYNFEDPVLVPLAAPTFSSDEGWGVIGRLEKSWPGFNKPIYKDKFILVFNYIPGLNSIKLKPKYILNDFIKDQNLRVRGRFAINDLSFDDIFGIGNDIIPDDELDDENFYKIKNNNFAFSVGLEKQFFNKSRFRYMLGVEHHNIDIRNSNSFFAENLTVEEFAFGKNSMLFLRTIFDINFLDNTTKPMAGSMMKFTNTIYNGVEGAFDTYGQFEGSFIRYATANIGRPTTLALKVGGSTTYGDAPFYHMTNLGNSRDLRAYRSNQFIGDSGVYFNSHLRYDLGTMFKNFLPIGIGLTGFYDSGRVFNNEAFSFDDWHDSYGGGFYLSLLNGQYNVSYTIGRNKFKNTFFKLELGFGIE